MPIPTIVIPVPSVAKSRVINTPITSTNAPNARKAIDNPIAILFIFYVLLFIYGKTPTEV